MIPVQISIITIDPSAIQSFERTVQNSHNFSEWIRLLNMYKHNQMWGKVRDCILDINSRFIVKEPFWIKELEEHWNRIDYQDSESVHQFWELMKLAFENQYKMHQFGEKLGSWVVHVYKSVGKFTLKQAEIKLQWLTERFRWDIDRGAQYYEKLRELYAPDQTDKIRSAYHAQFSNPFKSNDVILDQYRSWETDPHQLKKAQQSYERMLVLADQIINNIQNKNFDKIPVPLALKIKHEDAQYGDSDYLATIRREVSAPRRVEFLRREAKEGRLEIQYLEELQKTQIPSEEELTKEYSLYLERTLSHGSGSKIQALVKKYLCCLVRRVNKHLLATQPQEYLDTWGEKVTFLRQEIMRFIPKVYKGVQAKLYKYWADIETYVIKDAATVCSVYEELVKSKLGKTEVYLDYGQSMVVLGDASKGMEVLRKGIQKCEDNQSIKDRLKNLIDLFGNVEAASAQQEQKQMQMEAREEEGSKEEDSKKNESALDFAHKRPNNESQDAVSAKIVEVERRRHHSDSGKTLFLKGVPEEWTESDVLNLFDQKQEVADVRIVQSHKKRKVNDSYKCTNVCYVDFNSKEAAEAAIASNKRKDITMELSRPPRQERADDRTLLFAGLSPDATEKDIGDFLGDYQGVEDIRLLHDQNGSRGLAFIQFSSVQNYEQAWRALLKRKLTIKDKGFVMRECDNERSNTKSMSTVVFLEGLAYKATEADIERFFKSNGISNIKEIEIAKNDQQKSKGFAYVELSVFKDYQSALDLGVGSILGREFKIKKSDRKITQKGDSKQKPRTNSDFLKLFK